VRHQVHLAAQEILKEEFEVHEAEKAGRLGEFDQEIYVTILACLVPRHRPEAGKSLNPRLFQVCLVLAEKTKDLFPSHSDPPIT